MNILINNRWTGGFLDSHRRADEYRLAVLALTNVEKLDGIFFVRPFDWRLIANYLRDIGPREVARKVRSRFGERARNEKYFSIGIGRVLEAPVSGQLAPGSVVHFIATQHPQCLERVTIPQALVAPAPTVPDVLTYSHVLVAAVNDPASGAAFGSLKAWHPDSGVELQPSVCAAAIERAGHLLSAVDWRTATKFAISNSPVREQSETHSARRVDSRPTATLVGYGNYAKSVVLPSVASHLRVITIHELDPTQIGASPDPGLNWDTAPQPRSEDHSAVHLIAGFHHSHAPLAVAALEQGCYAVVEKPLAVSRQQCRALLTVLRQHPRFFACFHKRYLPFNSWVHADLGLRRGDPVSYHCIVYEVALPPHHWYRWPNSRSRLVSNGCHWLDHFLFLNDFAAVADKSLSVAPDGTINCTVSLVNGAVFTMVLTDVGSARLGVQDYIELRGRDTLIRMRNGSQYEAESSRRVIRRARAHRMESYKRMYQSVARSISLGHAGDSLESVAVSTGLVLDLEELYNSALTESAPSLTYAPDLLHPMPGSRSGVM